MSKIFFLQKNNARPKIHNSTKHAIYKHITHMQDKVIKHQNTLTEPVFLCYLT